jgi:hypothetical protein
MEWIQFVSLVDDGFSYMDAKKGTCRKNGIFDLHNYLRRVGLTPVPPPPATYCAEIGLCLRCIKHDDGFVRVFIQCSELNYMDRNRPLRIMFYAMYDKKHLDNVLENIYHNISQYLSLLQMRGDDVKFVTFASESIDQDELYDNPEDKENLEKIVEQLNDIFSK